MFDIEVYEDSQGNSPIADFFEELDTKSKTSKESRVRLKKISEYLNQLRAYGTRIGEPVTKHLKDEIWELRPFADRILFAHYKDGKFILLHHFEKKTRKTPEKEIEKAKVNLIDYIKRSV